MIPQSRPNHYRWIQNSFVALPSITFKPDLSVIKTNVFKVLYDPEADSALLVHNGMPLPVVISAADESFRGLRMDAKEIAELVDQFVNGGSIPMPGDLGTMSLVDSHEWMKGALSQCAVSLKTAYKFAAEFAKIAGPTDQYIFFKAASYGKLQEFNNALVVLVAEAGKADGRQAASPGHLLELLESSADNNEWNVSVAEEEVRRELSLGIGDGPGMSA